MYKLAYQKKYDLASQTGAFDCAVWVANSYIQKTSNNVGFKKKTDVLRKTHTAKLISYKLAFACLYGVLYEWKCTTM